ncbi:MAG: hypothetical protein ACE5LU_24995 [Anaerolineae bacterium]
MSAQGNSPTPGDLNDLLEHIQNRGTPFRIDGATGTYYVLSADQLIALLRAISEDGEPVLSFAPHDFGLTEADLAAYEARRKARREHINLDTLAPLDPNLEQRLHHLSQVQHERPLSEGEASEREQLLHELETAILDNLQASMKQAG